jgi:hypothetical protein
MTSFQKCLWRLLPAAALYFIAALPGWSQNCVQPVKLETVTVPYQLSAVNGAFTVQDPNNCGWIISAKPSWISSISPTSGHGNQLVNFTVAPPSQSGPRADMVVIGNQFETVFQQAAAPGPFCAQQRPVGPSPINAAAGGGRYEFTVGGGNQCSWGVTSTASWISGITLRAFSPDGSILSGAAVDFTVGPLTTAPILTGSVGRAAVILAANLPVTIYQAPDCTYTVSRIWEPDTAAHCAFVTACSIANVVVAPNPSTCSWNATKPADSFGPALNTTHTGYGYLPLHVNNYSTTSVATTVHLTGSKWTFDDRVTMAGFPCDSSTIRLLPPSGAISSLGGTATIGVTAPQGCAWNVSKPGWLSIQSNPGTGSGNLVVSAPATSASRSDAVTIAGLPVTVAQNGPQACTSSTVSPASVTLPAAGGSQTVTVSVTPAGCVWSATGAPGFNVTTGSGTATITTALANPSSHPRTGTPIIAGKNVPVTQQGLACNLQMTTPAQIPPAGGTVSIQIIATPSDCTWSATSSGTWFHIGPVNGMGSGQISVIANGPNYGRYAFAGSVSIGSLTVAVSQAGHPPPPFPHTIDYDRDGHADPMVFRPSNGSWYLKPSSGMCPANFTHISSIPGQQTCMRQFGLPGDIPIAADFDGDGLKDLGVWRQSQSTFFLETSSGACPANWVSTQNIDRIPMCTRQLAAGSVTPVAGDFDGDGRADLAFFRASDGRWIVWPSSGAIFGEFNEALSGTPAFMRQFGIPGDLPAPGDYDHDGITDVAVYRPSNPGVMILLPSSDVCPAHWSPVDPTPDFRRVCIRVTGTSEDVPVPADFDADGITDMALFRDAGQVWTVYPSGSVGPGIYANPGITGEGQPFASRQWGLPGDIAVPQDFDGDLKADLTVFRPAEGNWYVFPSSGVCPVRIPRAGSTPDGWAVCVVQWGLPGDIPMR